mmetsp:Transcript_93502/g.235530  ORF Transcript_93502/g.235530 Transcript_93502/m.235530 type:complete len:362 (-) Transcript_93502:229-1314(-)
MSSGKSSYLSYHLNFDVEEGYDVPEVAFQKRHHRTRQRPDGKPGLHGAHLLVRRQAKPRLLARSHSLPGQDEFADFFSEEEGAPRGTDAQSGAMEQPDWPSLHPVAGSVRASDSLGDSGLEAWAATKKKGWQSFGPFLAATAPPPDNMAQKWPPAKKMAPIPSDTPQKLEGQKSLEQKEQEEHQDVDEVAVGKYNIDDKDAILDPEIAEAASRLLPKLVEAHLQQPGRKISLGLMKLMLEDAVALGCLGTEHDEKPAEDAEDSVSAEGLVESLPVLDAHQDARDLRGKGWLKGHKASMGLRAAERFAEKAVRRSSQSQQSKGVTITKQGELGHSWTLHDKDRSKQHGGMLKTKKQPASFAS